jgi:hypothetical protein
MFHQLLNWVYSFISGCGDLWTWLITPIDITNDLHIAPIFLVCGATLIIGILRAIL